MRRAYHYAAAWACAAAAFLWILASAFLLVVNRRPWGAIGIAFVMMVLTSWHASKVEE